ncbi:MAG: SpoIIE family protein phosphatase [Lachnospiraceae bacterium]|nr:SpoIIE family protein phosphatase [Lachnospiraceae bacterium]
MIGDMSSIFSKLVGTLAVILVVSAFIGGSDILSKLVKTEKKWKYVIIAGILGGAFGIYGNISGFDLSGAVVSVRDIGPMLAGFMAGPAGGLIAGLVAGTHRMTLGGVTAQACVVATCCIGLFCGAVSNKWRAKIEKPVFAFLLSALMEMFHLGVVLIMVKPYETALSIVRQIALPFIFVNALGFMMMISIITYTERQRVLTAERSRMQSELEVANVIQHSLLPLIGDNYPGVKDLDVSGFMKAAKEVGGDFYDVFFVDPDHIAFVIGDVSGKGIPAALFMASSKITLQNCIRDIPNLSDAVGTANNVLCARNEAEMFVTVWVGVLDLKSGTMDFVSAGHNAPVLIRAGMPEFLKAKNGLVLAGMEDIRYRQNSVQLEKGDIVCLYTDGVTEADDNDKNFFGEKRLLGSLEGKSGCTSAEIIENVKSSVDEFICGNSQFDDMTMLCFKWGEQSL